MTMRATIAAAIIAATAALPASAGTVTFDDVMASPVFAGITPDGDDGPIVVRPGVTFTGGVILNAQEYNSAQNNVYATDSFQTLADGSNLPGIITADFDGAVDSISLDVFDGYIAGTFMLSAYGAGDVLLGTSSIALSGYPQGGPAPFGHLSFAGSGITSFTVTSDQGGDNVSFAIDTVSFDVPSPAPEPASWALMLGGFGLVGGAMRGRRRTVAAWLVCLGSTQAALAADVTVGAAIPASSNSQIYDFATLDSTGTLGAQAESHLQGFGIPNAFSGQAFGLAYNAAGQLVVGRTVAASSNSQIYDFATLDSSGALLSQAESHLQGFGIPNAFSGQAFGLAFNADGQLVVGTAVTATSSSQIYDFVTLDPSGALLSQAESHLQGFGIPNAFSGQAFGLAFNAAGQLTVGIALAASSNSQIYDFATLDSNGVLLSLVQSHLQGFGIPNAFSGQAFGLAYNAAGQLVVGTAVTATSSSQIYDFATLDSSGALLSQVQSHLQGFGVPNAFSGQAFGLAAVPAGASDVPEPASWAIMMIGFFGVGGLMRRARKDAYPTMIAA